MTMYYLSDMSLNMTKTMVRQHKMINNLSSNYGISDLFFVMFSDPCRELDQAP
jgi:hypothetical protein